MFTQADLTNLINHDARTAVSIFMPTHQQGPDIRQDAIRLKNLLSRAQSDLGERGDLDGVLSDAWALVDDSQFWQHQRHGLALFIDENETRHFRVPLTLEEQVVIGAQFHVTPLLPLLDADGAFYVLTVTADDARLFRASRFTLEQDESAELPRNPLRGEIDDDYESPVQASPPARPNVGQFNIPNAQVFGDSPAEFKKTQLLEYVSAVAKSVENHVASRPLPLVLVADKVIGGHLRHSAGVSRLLAGVVDTNPAALEQDSLHEAAYREVKETLDRGRSEALEAAATAVGRADGSALTHAAQIAHAAGEGRIAALLLGEQVTSPGIEEPNAPTAETEATGDLLSRAAIETLRNGGSVQVFSDTELPGETGVVALLRY